MEMAAAALLGIVQGLTEFLPISSSAHLILVPWALGWTPEGLAFDVSLHVGTAVAVLAYFWTDWIVLGREAILGILERAPLANRERKLAWCLIVGTLPAMVAGLSLGDRIEESLRSPLVTVVTLTVFGCFLYYAERRGRQMRTTETLSWSDAIWIGISQAVALVPGVSRSGITISAALLRDFDRSSATRFSFLLATPVVVGAGILEARRLMQTPAAVNWAVFGIGVACAVVTGLLCIRYFLRYVRSNTFTPFVLYRFALAVTVLMFYLKYWR
jgi:undecaprenyl-diphosphatase